MEGMQEGNWAEKQFRADAESDPVQALLAKMSPEEAIEMLEEKVVDDPEDAESVRMLSLLKNRPELYQNEEGETLH